MFAEVEFSSMNKPGLDDSSPSTHDIYCTKSDCVLPACINLKLQQMKTKMTNTKTHDKRIKSCTDQNMEMDLTAVVESTDNFWHQDLEDLVNILGSDICGNTSSSPYPEDDGVIILDDERYDQPSSALQHALDQKLIEPFFFQDPLFTQMPLCSQKEVGNQYVAQLQGSVSPGINVQSNGPVCLVSQHLGIGQAVSSADGARIVPNVNVTDNTIQPISTPSAFITSYKMDCAVLEAEAGSCGVKRSSENQSKCQVEYSDREKTGNSSPIKRKPMIPIQSTNKLFGILSLILQAFDDSLTTELEERYICVLQRALLEIQNARCALQHSQGQQN